MECATKHTIFVSEMIKIFMEYVKEQTYQVFVEYFDSIYGVTGVECTEDEETVILSEETKGAGSKMTVSDLMKKMENASFSELSPLICAPADAIDLSLDMQMTEEAQVYGIQVDDLCKMVLLKAL